MKKYLLISLKRKLPVFIVISVIFLLSALTSVMSQAFLIEHYSQFEQTSLESGLLGYQIVFMLSMMVLPFFSMNYRYSLERGDTFKQAPFKSNRIRWIEHLTALILILIAFTIGYLIMVFGFMIKNYTTVLPDAKFIGFDVDNNPIFITYEIRYYNYIYYLPAYFVILAFGILQYFITYLLISRSNNFMSSFIMLIVGQLALLAINYFFYQFSNAGAKTISFLFNGSFTMPIVLVYQTFSRLIIGGTSMSLVEPYLAPIVGIVIFVITGFLGISAFFFENDPSSEYFGTGKTERPYQEFVYHIGVAIAISSLLSIFTSIIGIFFFFGFFVTMYYVFYGILTRNFRLNLKRLLYMGVTLATIIIFGFVIPFIMKSGSYTII